jgi:hypothetical protein
LRQRCGDSLNLPDPESKDFQRALIYRPDGLEIGKVVRAGGLKPE